MQRVRWSRTELSFSCAFSLAALQDDLEVVRRCGESLAVASIESARECRDLGGQLVLPLGCEHGERRVRRPVPGAEELDEVLGRRIAEDEGAARRRHDPCAVAEQLVEAL